MVQGVQKINVGGGVRKARRSRCRKAALALMPTGDLQRTKGPAQPGGSGYGRPHTNHLPQCQQLHLGQFYQKPAQEVLPWINARPRR